MADERRGGFSFGASLRAARRPAIAERRAAITPVRVARAPPISVGARIEQRLGAAGARAFLSNAATGERTTAPPVSPPSASPAQATPAIIVGPAATATVPATAAVSATPSVSAAPSGREIKKVVERGPAGTEVPVEAPAPTPNLATTVAPLARALRQRARIARDHKLGKEESVHVARQAAIAKPTEQGRIAATKTVDKLREAGDEAVVKPFDSVAFEGRLTHVIEQQMTQARTKEEAEKVMNQGAANASATLGQNLKPQSAAAAGGLPAAADHKNDASPGDQNVPEPPELQPEGAGPAPTIVDSRPAVPAPLPAEQLDFSADRGPTDQAMAENHVTTEQMQEGNDPAFGPALSARADAERHEAEAPGSYRKEEAKIRADATARAQGVVRAGLSGMHGVRERELEKVAGQQLGVRLTDTFRRTLIMARITEIKNQVQADVNAILEEMDREVARIFTAGLQQASEKYEAEFSDVRGSSLKQYFMSDDNWEELVGYALARARGIYKSYAVTTIHEVATYVGKQVEAAKERAARGEREANAVLDLLGGEMSDFAAQARESIGTDYGSMQSQIDGRCDALIGRLSVQLKDSCDKLKEREEELREESRSIWDRVYDATVGAIKKIIEFKNLLFSVLAKAASVVLDIIAHPIRFLGNLCDAVGQGLRNFKKNIGTHLEKGLMDWLFGAVAGAGLKLPEKFDLEGIVSIVLQILGLTYENFRARAVNLLGEQIVASLEKGAEVFMVFMREGAAGIWRFIKEKVADLKSLVLDAIWSFIKEEVIMAGIEWIIGLLNPVSAFFKACKAIYEIIVFVVNRASQLVAFVSAVVDSLAAIVAGNLGAAAAAVEDALARAIPLAIGLLASLLGLGDPSKTVKSTIDKARSPINKAIDWVIHGAVKLVKAAGNVVKRLVGKKNDGKEGAESSRAAVYDSISATLGERLSQDHTLDEARGVVAAVAHEFKPMGVSQILVAAPDEEGNSAIVVEMSPGREISYMTPSGKIGKPSVHLDVVLKLAPGPAMPEVGTVPGAIKPANDKRDYKYLGAVLQTEGSTLRDVLVSQSGVYKKYETVTVGGIIFPEKGGQIRLRTWNTDSQELQKHSNQTHAERQFVHWLTQMKADPVGKTVLDRITGVEARLVSLSPCSMCGDLFKEIKNEELLPKTASLRISWSRLYSGPSGPTSVGTVRDITGAGWTIEAPEEAMPQGTPREHYVNRPRKR